jgi:hypothetical protein
MNTPPAAVDISFLKEAGLTDGEAKVYLALLKTGNTTVGPIIDESGVAHSIIYTILEKLVQKGLVSYIIKDKTKRFQAEPPRRLLDYIGERQSALEESKSRVAALLPQLELLRTMQTHSSVQMFEGFKGVQTAWELQYAKLKRGEEHHSWGVHAFQEERFHLYWQRDHIRRGKLGIGSKLMFNEGTDRKILENRNSYKGCEARYMPSGIKTPAWFVVYKDVTSIFLQLPEPMAVVIVNKEIAETFEAYFQDFWRGSKPFVKRVKK